jgi:hypothetical protein
MDLGGIKERKRRGKGSKKRKEGSESGFEEK